MIKTILFISLLFFIPNTLEKQFSWLKEIVEEENKPKYNPGTGRKLFTFQETKCSLTVYDIGMLPPEEGGNWLSKQFDFKIINGKRSAIIRHYEFDFKDVYKFEIKECNTEPCYMLNLYTEKEKVYLEAHNNSKTYQNIVPIALYEYNNIKELEKRISKIISLCKKL